MNYLILEKEKLNELVNFLKNRCKVVGPKYLGNDKYKYGEIETSDELCLKHIPTILPPKKYFMPQEEKLLDFDISNSQEMKVSVDLEEIIIFGVHTCDLAGIQCLNIVFNEKPKDINYMIRQEAVKIIIGIECNEYCDSYASCALLGNHEPMGGYDLFFTDIGDEFMVEVNTQIAEDVVIESGYFSDVTVGHREKFNKIKEKKKKTFKSEIDITLNELPELMKKTFYSKVWDNVGDRCLACANCTNVCPTCYCFDVFDDVNLDLKTGSRVRKWDSCQNEDFAKVAGGESFRERRSARQRHRYNRKFNYPVEKYSHFFCTGCGRCSRTCMAEIDLKETINDLINIWR